MCNRPATLGCLLLSKAFSEYAHRSNPPKMRFKNWHPCQFLNFEFVLKPCILHGIQTSWAFIPRPSVDAADTNDGSKIGDVFQKYSFWKTRKSIYNNLEYRYCKLTGVRVNFLLTVTLIGKSFLYLLKLWFFIRKNILHSATQIFQSILFHSVFHCVLDVS